MTTTAEALLSTCDIKLTGRDVAANEPQVLARVMDRIGQHATQAMMIQVFCTPRRADGWLEWVMRVQYNEKHGITIGIVQRALTADVEFHS